MAGCEVVQLAGRFDNLFNAWVAEFYDIPGLHIDQMVMLHAMVGLFKLCDIPAKLMLDHEIAIQKQLNRVIQRGPAYTVVLVLHEYVKRLNIKVAIPGVYLIQDGIPLRRFTVSLLFKILCEYLLYSLFGLLHYHNLV